MPMSRMTLVTPPISYPVTLAEAKAQCRVDGTDSDAEIEGLIAAATAYLERYTGRAFMEQTWKLWLDEFSDTIQIPLGPVQSVTSIKYSDAGGIEQTASASIYTLDNQSDPAWIVLNSGESWPTAMDVVNAVSVIYVAGYSTMPPDIKHALLMVISQWYDHRHGVSDKNYTEIPHTVAALLCNHRSFSF